MFVLSREEMYAIDKYTIENIGIPGQELMENAGKECSKFINDLILPESKIAIFCGSGNNGGDGFVVARYLHNWKHLSKIFLMGSTDKMSPETLINFNRCKELGISINKINESEKTIVAIDIASGIDANTGQAKNAIKAYFTLTMAAMKYGQLLGEGRKKSSEILVIDIGIPGDVFLQFPLKGKLATYDNVVFPYRSRFSHKGNYGKVGIIAGSPGFTGAAILASKAALRAGAGMITLFHLQGLETIFENQLLEIMTYIIPKLPFGKGEKSNLLESEGLSEFFNKLNSMDVLLIGPGIGISKEMYDLLDQITVFWNKPLILDADALNIIADNKNILENISGKQVILTPHIGEFARLCDVTTEDILLDPLRYLQNFVAKYKCNVLLKSATSIYCGKTGFIFDTTGNDGLSTGGSGDVLAGIITSFAGQQLSLKNAAVSASFLMGETAEKLAEIRKPASIIPSDIIENIFKY